MTTPVPTEARAARVVVADADALFLAAVAALVRADDDLDLVACRGDVADLADVVAETGADLVIVGAALVGDGGRPLWSKVKSSGVTGVIVIDRDPDDDRLVEFVACGVDGYLSRLDDVEDLFDAIHGVLEGHAHVPTEMLGGLLRSLIDQRRELDAVTARFNGLTRREVEVLGHLVRGSAGDDIAEELYISAATVRTHVQNVLRKLDVHSQVEAADLVRRHGLLEGDDVGWSS